MYLCLQEAADNDEYRLAALNAMDPDNICNLAVSGIASMTHIWDHYH
jgi:hypothetical protein